MYRLQKRYTTILKKKGKWDDVTISPAIRQTLQHWGYKLTKKDYDSDIKSRTINNSTN